MSTWSPHRPQPRQAGRGVNDTDDIQFWPALADATREAAVAVAALGASMGALAHAMRRPRRTRHGRRRTARERRTERTRAMRRGLRFDRAVSRGDTNARRYLTASEWESWVELCSNMGASTVTGIMYG